MNKNLFIPLPTKLLYNRKSTEDSSKKSILDTKEDKYALAIYLEALRHCTKDDVYFLNVRSFLLSHGKVNHTDNRRNVINGLEKLKEKKLLDFEVYKPGEYKIFNINNYAKRKVHFVKLPFEVYDRIMNLNDKQALKILTVVVYFYNKVSDYLPKKVNEDELGNKEHEWVYYELKTTFDKCRNIIKELKITKKDFYDILYKLEYHKIICCYNQGLINGKSSDKTRNYYTTEIQYLKSIEGYSKAFYSNTKVESEVTKKIKFLDDFTYTLSQRSDYSELLNKINEMIEDRMRIDFTTGSQNNGNCMDFYQFKKPIKGLELHDIRLGYFITENYLIHHILRSIKGLLIELNLDKEINLNLEKFTFKLPSQEVK